MMALQPNKEIKYPHSPPNGETVSDISAKHRVYRGREAEHITRRSDCQFDVVLRELDPVHRSFLMDFRAAFDGMIQ
jgi:hypothetical protein